MTIVQTLTAKLLIKPGCSVLVLAAPDGYVPSLEPLAEGARVAQEGDAVFDVVQLFVRSRADLETRMTEAVRRTRAGRVLWITYPKQTGTIKTDINRDSVRTIMARTGWRPVTQIAIDETWSALRFRPLDEVGV